ncbi:MAG: hypothetical protein K5891_05110 [Lachnospiraceae bacterium]|nr:hypothetical protein [Lachnospiraceae bacterium]
MRKKMLLGKKTLAALLAVTLLLSMTGCGKKGAQQTAPDNSVTTTAQQPESNGADAQVDTGAAGEDAGTSGDAAADTAEKPQLSMEIRSHYLRTAEEFSTPNEEMIPYAYVLYQTLEPSGETAEAYPELAAALTDYNNGADEMAMSTLVDGASLMEEYLGYEAQMYGSNERCDNLTIHRADSRLFSFEVSSESWFNGPHPNTIFNSFNYDPQTGDFLQIRDVMSHPEELPEMIFDHLEWLDDTYVFEEEENIRMKERIREYVADDVLCWTVDEKGIAVTFDAYALQFYAFGPMWSVLTFEDYPDLLLPQYVCDEETAPFEDRFVVAEAPEEIFELQELYALYGNPNEAYEGSGDAQEAYYLVENHGWEAYISDAADRSKPDSPITLKQSSKEAIDFAENWASAHDLSLPVTVYQYPNFTDGIYEYEVTNEEETCIMVRVRNAVTGEYIGEYDFSEYLNPPDTDYNDLFWDVTQTRILNCQAMGGILYVSIGHRTYASAQPHKAYIVAVDMQDGSLLWRSAELLSNAYNIVLTTDTILCGYGFTNEPDYLYVLNRRTGEVYDSYKVDSKIDYILFDPEAYTVRIFTYNYTYLFDMIDK